MTTREIIAAFLIYFGAQSVAGAIMYTTVVESSTLLEVVFLTMGVAFVAGGVAILKWWND